MSPPKSICPFRMQAGLVLEAQRTRIAVAGRDESRAVQMDLNCIGVDCLVFVKTGINPESKTPIGACGLGASPVYIVQLGTKIDDLNKRIDTLTLSMVESVEEDTNVAAEQSWLRAFARKMRTFFGPPEADDAPAVPDKPKLEALDGGKE